ncbi:aminoacetone oxidase family FAD-binding enzyme [Campylobacter sp. RM9344]|uniref:Aminoacetone oxidase family FAD-binding enzyme n=1 Tax=Campylobacter californiensis TaxID=1032243 RepID=A0AAW3ZRS0_9BACT|nr:aminoacetone oxidase family FAD-binding enzyme [Campylobacter sp. RM6883]MBE2995774.1 aminoacetone oxidase family FAD-binding enzyme [Campylobacter sp. RM6913]MBE3030179.1 aminoacetone oxidase family FAD-binding enzyme [Campylobacter sp. RM9344]MBE3607834.1 aminoacetone oxidase family FAD-binding enzyme [Campylobacter sp. RM9337]
MSDKVDKIYDVLIIGAGASGLFLAANLKAKNVAILEKNPSAGNKILTSGGGRCNITNRHISEQNYLTDGKFIKKALNAFKFNDVLDFFKNIEFKEQKESQFFTKSSSKSVLNTLLQKINAKIFYNTEVINASKNGEIFEILSTKGEKFYAVNLVVATGGISYKRLGVSDIGLKIAQNFGLKTINFSPALVGFSVQKSEFWFKELSGISLNAKMSVGDKNLQGDILFTHKGISGPCVLNASLFWQKGTISINFLPNFEPKNLTQGKKQLTSVLPLPKRFVLEFLRQNNIQDAAFSEYSNDEKAKILELFNYRFAPAGTFGFDKAEVSKGGVTTAQIDENFQSKDIKNLYFIGEVLDVTGMLGGYNLHFAFTSAKIVSNALNKVY